MASGRGTAASARPFWLATLLAGTGLALVSPALPEPAAVAFNSAVHVGGLLAMAAGVRWHRPAARTAWRLLIAGRLVWVITNAYWNLTVEHAGSVPHAALVTLGFFVQYPPIAAALLIIANRRDGQRKHHAAIDAAIVTGGLSVLLWTFAVEPFVQLGRLTTAQLSAGLTFTVCDLLVLAAVVRLGLLSGRPDPGTVLLSGFGAALLAGDVVYYLTVLIHGHGQLAAPAVPNLLWQMSAALAAAAALHPALRRPPPRRRVARDGLIPRWQLAAFILLALLVPAVPVTAAALARPLAASAAGPLAASGAGPLATSGVGRYLVPAVIAAVVSVLLVVRLGMVVQVANRRALELQRSLGQREALERELHHRAMHDPLTGLANRALLVERLDRPAPGLSMLLLDLDGFKDVNDTLGHPAGDELLIEVSRRLRAALPAAELLARLGGDEFAVLWRSSASTGDLPERVLACLRPPYPIGGRDVHVTGSVGLLDLDDQATSADALRDADLALYAAKDAGKDQVARFTPDLRVARTRHAELTAGLRRAVARDELTVHYQPVVRLQDGRVTAVEALLRWSPPDGGSVPPTAFIPIAEATGLIVPIGWWVLRRACLDARRWYLEYGVCVTVNVSGHQLREADFVDTVLRVLAETGLPGRALVLELTETTLITAAVGGLDKLREHGVRVAIDDFGTGYSSLSYLVQLPVDILKIDRAFTGPPGQPAAHHWAFTRAILDLAGSLELDTIAEGVETVEQADTLRALDCPYAQGYLYSRPVPAGQIDELVAYQPATGVRL